MPYLSIELAECSVGPGISCGACKLTRTPQITKKKKKGYLHRTNIYEKVMMLVHRSRKNTLKNMSIKVLGEIFAASSHCLGLVQITVA